MQEGKPVAAGQILMDVSYDKCFDISAAIAVWDNILGNADMLVPGVFHKDAAAVMETIHGAAPQAERV